MAQHNAPIPTYTGSQTEFSKVWIRGSTTTATLPNIKLYRVDGRLVHPVAGNVDVTIVHTAAATLYSRIQAAVTAADATMTAARFQKWWDLNKVAGFACDAITGDILLVNRAEGKGLTDTNPDDLGINTARAAADFYAQETYAVGAIFSHGIIPSDAPGVGTISVAATLTEVSKAEDAAHASGDKGIMALAVRQDTPAALAGTTGDYIPLTTTSMGRLRAAATCEAISGTASLGNPNDALTFSNAQGFNTMIFVTDGTVPIIAEGSIDGTNYLSLPWWQLNTLAQTPRVTGTTITANTPYMVDTCGMPIVRVRRTSGTSTVAATGYLSSSDPMNSVVIGGGAGHGQAVSGNPALVGIEARSSDGTAVDSGDIVRALGSLLGKLVSLPYALPGLTWQYAKQTAGGTTDTSDVTLAAAGAASVRNFVTAVQIVNMSTTATEVVIKDGLTILWRCELDADGGASGISVIFPTPLKGTAATAVTAACVTTGAKVYINAQGYSGAE